MSIYKNINIKVKLSPIFGLFTVFLLSITNLAKAQNILPTSTPPLPPQPEPVEPKTLPSLEQILPELEQTPPKDSPN
ncbi:MAG: hypothetical protein WBM86_13755, partial [Waterburya sp.]